MLLLMLVTLALSACDFDSILDVENPGSVVDEALDNPALAGVLVNSVVGAVECSWDNYVAGAAHHSDEWIASSANFNLSQWGLRGVSSTLPSMASGSCADSYGIYATLHSARFLAATSFTRIEGFAEQEVPQKTEHLARIRAYGAWSFIAFSEGFCGTPLDGAASVLGPTELAQLADDWFTEAIQLAGQAGLSDIETMARVGRARARLTLGRFDEVIADAALVPEMFEFSASRDATPVERRNAHYAAVNGTASEAPSSKHATISPAYRSLDWMGVADTRVGAYADGSAGHDGGTAHWRHDKVNSFAAPTLMASWKEAQLFMAEAYARSSRTTESLAILNGFHLRAGLPGITAADVPGEDDVLRHVIEERRRELFSEGGHRLRDHVRWRATPTEVPFLGEPGSIHPNGVWLNPDTDAPGALYQGGTCFPVPVIEGVGE